MARKSTNRPADIDSVSSPSLLTVKDLQVCCDPALLDFEDTSNLEPLPGLIGQERALDAIKLAASITHADFNLFVMGPGGAGRHSAVQTLLEVEAAKRSVPPDWVYVNDFANPNRPKAISLPPGTAQPLQKAVEVLVDDLATDIPALFESEQYQTRRSAFEQRLATRKQDAFEKVVEKSHTRSVTILRTPMGFAAIQIAHPAQHTDKDSRNAKRFETIG